MKAGRKSGMDPVLLIALLLVVALAAGWIKLPMAVSGDQGQGQQSGSDCAGLANQPIVYATADWIDPTQNNKRTQAATTMLFAKTDSPVVYNSTTGSATTQTTCSVPCGMPVTVVAGDGGGTTYYYGAKSVPTVDKVSIDATGILVQKSGAATIYVHNSSETGWASVTSLGLNTSITDPDTTVKLLVRVPTTAGAYFGDLGWAMCIHYNSGNVTQVYPQPYKTAVSIPSVKAGATSYNGNTAYDSVACYEMPGTLVSAGSDWEGTLYIDVAGAATARDNSSAIGITIADKTSILFNGKLYQGYDTSITDGQNTDAGRANVNTAVAVGLNVTLA